MRFCFDRSRIECIYFQSTYSLKWGGGGACWQKVIFLKMLKAQFDRTDQFFVHLCHSRMCLRSHFQNQSFDYTWLWISFVCFPCTIARTTSVLTCFHCQGVAQFSTEPNLDPIANIWWLHIPKSEMYSLRRHGRATFFIENDKGAKVVFMKKKSHK